jgi:hypothetical protein
VAGNEKYDTHKHTNIKQKSWGWEDCMFLIGYLRAYLNQSVYFIGQYTEKTWVKIKL